MAIALISFILVFLGYNVYDRLETTIQKDLETKADTISYRVIESTRDKVRGILAFNIDTLQQKKTISSQLKQTFKTIRKDTIILFIGI